VLAASQWLAPLEKADFLMKEGLGAGSRLLLAWPGSRMEIEAEDAMGVIIPDAFKFVTRAKDHLLAECRSALPVGSKVRVIGADLPPEGEVFQFTVWDQRQDGVAVVPGAARYAPNEPVSVELEAPKPGLELLIEPGAGGERRIALDSTGRRFEVGRLRAGTYDAAVVDSAGRPVSRLRWTVSAGAGAAGPRTAPSPLSARAEAAWRSWLGGGEPEAAARYVCAQFSAVLTPAAKTCLPVWSGTARDGRSPWAMLARVVVEEELCSVVKLFRTEGVQASLVEALGTEIPGVEEVVLIDAAPWRLVGQPHFSSESMRRRWEEWWKNAREPGNRDWLRSRVDWPVATALARLAAETEAERIRQVGRVPVADELMAELRRAIPHGWMIDVVAVAAGDSRSVDVGGRVAMPIIPFSTTVGTVLVQPQ